MAGFDKEAENLAKLDATIVVVSVDSLEKAREVADEVSYDVAYGATRANADAVGAWWGEERGIIQPAEFVLDADGKVLAASYSTGPLGRIDGADVVQLLNLYEKRARGG